ncbi:MAG: lytic transglycosylase domain-containing protein [Rhodospirillales bacterium]|nr:lytic transglycosylase domain-containing protein [Alphaproteobacteria bacterium]MCB9987634.1 lytic transglycosylase domain-containing protein [Rhodospirillales bacterium]USO08067.1 MAG: lytic transglycosylase domain-containing protein [Rhodospirillales bacterium]
MTPRFGALLLAFCLFAALPARADGVSAVRAAENGNWTQARVQAGSDHVARAVVDWIYLTDDKTRASFPEIAAFVTQHPDWPSVDKLYRVAEGRLPDDLSTTQVINWFSRNKPVSGAGMERYMGALMAQGQSQGAASALRSWWVDANLSPDEQGDIIRNYGQMLGMDDHIRRLERMLGDRQYSASRALAGMMGNDYARMAEARIALQEGSSGAAGQLGGLSRAMLNDTGLLLARVQNARVNNQDSEAVALLDRAPPAGQTTDAAAWWKERNIMARRMFEAGRYRDAYRLAAGHGLPSSGGDFAAAEFFAGWIALRYLNQPYPAFEHFERLFNNTSTPISRARAAYWAGRASEAMRSDDVALQWYQVAARYQTTFYGQQAAAHINLPLNLIKGDKPSVSRAQQAAFNARDMVRAVQLLHRAGDSGDRALFLRTMIKQAETPQDFSMLSDFAASMGQVDIAVKVAKEAEKTGLYLTDYAFPTIMHAMAHTGTDKALVHALIRQESQFDPNAVSSSGALGLMQIMPATGKHTAKLAGLKHDTAWLTQKPEHNVKIGTLYIQELLDRYNGSAPLAIAAYNAGPGRVNQWLDEFGDPRGDSGRGRIDMIDWIESIPIYETRNYVQRVMEGYAVYRAKLGHFNGQPPLRIQRMNTAYNP